MNRIFMLMITLHLLTTQVMAQSFAWPIGTVSIDGKLMQTVGRDTDPGAVGYKYNTVSFYVVAHQDDWQIFMGQQAWYDTRSYDAGAGVAKGAKVVFIYITDGCYHKVRKEDNPCEPNDIGFSWRGEYYCEGAPVSGEISYCKVREHAAMSSVHLLAAQSGLNAAAAVYNETKPSTPILFNGHSVQVNRYKNTVSYFLRLSTYSLNKWTYGIFGPAAPYPKFCDADRNVPGYINDGTDKIQAKPEYGNYEDFVTTIREIYNYETNISGDVVPGRLPWVNIQDPSMQFDDNLDHHGAGQIAFDADVQFSVSMGGVEMPVNLWKGYCIDNSTVYPQNLWGADVQQKSALFSAYVMETLKQRSVFEWDGHRAHRMNKSYNRLSTTTLGY
jgi:hypothetical protein